MIALPEFSNTQALIIELTIGLAVAVIISVYFGRKQNSILNKIKDLTNEQSELINIMESRRRNRIRWFKHHSLGVLKRVKESYEKLSKAIDEYAANPNEANRKKIEAIAETSLQIPVYHAKDLIINRDLPIAAEYLENTWIIAKLPDYLSLMGQGFDAARRSPLDIANIREIIDLSMKDLDFAIEQITSEKDDLPSKSTDQQPLKK